MSQLLPPLPLSIAPSDSIEEIRRVMALARERLEALERQAFVYDLADFFLKAPDLFRFSFKIYNKGTHSPWPRVFINDSQSPHFEEHNPRLCELGEAMADWIDIDEPFFRSWEGRVFERPVDASLLFESLMRQALDPEDFSRWQAGFLDRSCEESEAPGARAPRVL